MSHIFAQYGISAERERVLWREQNRKDLLEHASLPLGKKIDLVENMVELARSVHGGNLAKSADEHEERTDW